MTFKQILTTSGLLTAVLLLSACGTDVAVVTSPPTPPLDDIAFDSAKASEGEGLYDSYCAACHDDRNAPDGERGTYSGKLGADIISPIKHSTYATPMAIDENRMAVYATGSMPTTNKSICDFDCQDKIQHFFYRHWTELNSPGASSSIGQSSSTASSSANTPANFQGNVDKVLAAQGKTEFEAQCTNCHGDFGGNDGDTLTSNQYPIHNNRITYTSGGMSFGTLEEIIGEQMPKGNAANCDATCANATSEYIRSWTYINGTFAVPDLSSNGSSSAGSSSSAPSGLTQGEIDARVAAGLALYQANNCAACHGADGTTEGFAVIVDTTLSYEGLVAIIASGVSPLMAPCTPSGSCAAPIADYIWVEFLGATLTADGGI